MNAGGDDGARPGEVPVPPRADLLEVLGRSRELGLLGPGPVEEHLHHAQAFVDLVTQGARVLDLGSGGGLPGLVLAARRPDLQLRLVDAGHRRCEVLREAVRALGVTDRVEVIEGRAEVLARRPELRGWADVVVARSFGPPAVTAECAVGFLRAEGLVLVSEPPEGSASSDRWPPAGLAQLGLIAGPLHRRNGASVQELRRSGDLDDRYPRRDGVPARRPLF